MPHEGPTIYDYLAKYKVSELTVELLDSATKNTAITPENLEFWRDIIAVSRIISDSRTYPHGLPAPQSGAVWSNTIGPVEQLPARPDSASEVWRVEHINADNATATLTDGVSSSVIGDAASNHSFYVTNTLWLNFSNETGAPVTPTVAYSKVSF